jgi:hypothetical protein
MYHQQVNKLQNTLWPISPHTHLDALLCPVGRGSKGDNVVTANTIEVICS